MTATERKGCPYTNCFGILIPLSSINKRKCSSCGKEVDWNLDPGQKSTLIEGLNTGSMEAAVVAGPAPIAERAKEPVKSVPIEKVQQYLLGILQDNVSALKAELEVLDLDCANDRKRFTMLMDSAEEAAIMAETLTQFRMLHKGGSCGRFEHQ